MEHIPCYQTQNALCSSPTLDIRQLLASDCTLEPLISESISLDTLSSTSSDQVPPFSTSKLLRLSIIGLGDHLKMFSGPLTHLQEPTNPKVLITSPTSPRLKSMFKECLCISKWAVSFLLCYLMTMIHPFSFLKECLIGWRAPGHIPWGSIQDQATVPEKWLPEGSLFSPEDFSRSLNQARSKLVCAETAETEQGLRVIVNASLDKHANMTERMDLTSSSGTLTHMELVNMMRELKDIKNFFEGTSQQEVSRTDQQPKNYPEQLTLPSLMISNSHCTFPLSLDSCQSFTLKPAANLADRRGRKPPPPLLLKDEIISPELSYPGIPTAFLGSPSTYSPNFQDVNLANPSGLPIEDMISNLRHQCSSMTLHTPPVDMSWNSQSRSASPTPVYEPVKKSMEAEVVEFVESAVASTPFPSPLNNASPDTLGRRLVTLTLPTGRQKGTSLSRARAMNSPEVGTAPKILEMAKSTRTDTPDKKPEVLSKHTPSPPLLLRSSLAKHSSFRSRSLKCVRFALSPLEFEKDVASLMYDNVRRSSAQSPSHLYGNAPVKKNTTPHLNPEPKYKGSEEKPPSIRQNAKSRRPTSTAIKVSSSMETKERIKPNIIEPPLRHSMVQNIICGDTYGHDSTQRSLQSRGRHSLSRIIKGPIFSGKENKRATVSNTFSTRWDLNEKGTAMRDSVASESKKSRMPVPLRNILTRFK